MSRALLFLCLAAAGCTQSPRMAESHRKVAGTCPVERPASNAGAGKGGGDCHWDTNCVDINARCVANPRFGDSPPFICSEDECYADADCPGDKVCECRDATQFGLGANHCVGPGNCRVDADCGAGGACSPSGDECGRDRWVVGYFCHTPQDECLDDSDCDPPDSGLFKPSCFFDAAAAHWTCRTQLCPSI